MDLSKVSEKEMMAELTKRRNARLSGALYLIERSDGERSLQFNMPGFTSNTRILDQVKVVVGEDSKIKLEPFYPVAALAQAKADAYLIGSRMKGDGGISSICPYVTSPAMIGFCLTQQHK